MLSKGKFRYIRSVYRSLESKRRFNELFGDPFQVDATIMDLSDILHLPIEPMPVYPHVTDCSTLNMNVSEFPMAFLRTEKGPENNVTYL